MAGYFVSGDPDLHMDSGLLADEIAQRWPTVRFLERNDADNVARWAVRMPSNRELFGELQSSGQAIELEGDVYDAAEFARWVRTQVPDRLPLYFFDEGYTQNLPVTSGTSTAELAEPFVARQ